MKKLGIVLFTLLMLFPMMAEDVSLTVDQAVERALENNLGLQMNAIELRTRRRTMDTVWNNFVPEINASVGLNSSGILFGETIPSVNFQPSLGSYNPATGNFDEVEFSMEDGNRDFTTSLQAGVQMNLPINMALGKGIRQTVLDYEAGLLNFEKASNELEVNIRKQFWLIKALQAGVELDRRNIDTLERRLEQTQINFENGLVPELAVLAARVELENTRPGLDKKISELESSLAFFKFLLGLSQEDEFELLGELEVEIHEFESSELIERFLHQRLDVQEINHQIVSLENTKAMTGLYNLTPSLILGLTWGTQVGDEPFNSDSWDPFYDNMQLSATLAIPLDGFIPFSKKDVQLRELQDGIDSLELARNQVYESARIEISNLVRKLETSQATLEAYAYNVELAEKNYQLNSEAYELGTVELLDVQDAQDNLYQAEYGVLFEKFNYLSTLLDLELALNSSLEEISE